MPIDDAQLLRIYVAERFDDAFRKLVRRHIAFVYGWRDGKLASIRTLLHRPPQRHDISLPGRGSPWGGIVFLLAAGNSRRHRSSLLCGSPAASATAPDFPPGASSEKTFMR